MRVTVKLFAFFREDRFKSKEFNLEEGTTVSQVRESLGIPAEEVGVTMINSRHCQADAELSENDTLSIFPLIGGG